MHEVHPTSGPEAEKERARGLQVHMDRAQAGQMMGWSPRALGRPVVIGLAWVAMLAACSPAGAGPSTLAGASGAGGPAAAGQRIFEVGAGPDGAQIPRSGGIGMMGGSGCAACHGANGHGIASMMIQAPNITYANLTDPAGMLEIDGGRGPVYTDAEIERAVEDGIGADGDQLDKTMPRWQLTDAEWQDLLAYLKTLH